MRKKVGQVSVDEKNQIQALFERKNGLIELSKIIDSNNTSLYEKLVIDMGETNVRFQNWWNEMSTKYAWEKALDGEWEIDFQTCEIFLITNI